MELSILVNIKVKQQKTTHFCHLLHTIAGSNQELHSINFLIKTE